MSERTAKNLEELKVGDYEVWFEAYARTYTKDQWCLRDAFEAGYALAKATDFLERL